MPANQDPDAYELRKSGLPTVSTVAADVLRLPAQKPCPFWPLPSGPVQVEAPCPCAGRSAVSG